MHRTLIHIFLDPDIYRRVIILRLRQISCCQIRKQDVERFAALYKRFLADRGGDHIFCDHFFGSGNLIKSNDRHILFLTTHGKCCATATVYTCSSKEKGIDLRVLRQKPGCPIITDKVVIIICDRCNNIDIRIRLDRICKAGNPFRMAQNLFGTCNNTDFCSPLTSLELH